MASLVQEVDFDQFYMASLVQEVGCFDQFYMASLVQEVGCFDHS